MENTNTILIGGKVLYVFPATPNVTILKIGLDHNNVAEVVAFGNQAKAALMLSVGDFVSILGNIQSSNKTGKCAYCLFANSIKKINKPIKENSFHVAGEIIGICSQVTFTNYFIKTKTDGHTSVFPITIYNCINHIENLEAGKRIFASGRLQTYKSIKNDTVICKNNFVSTAIHVLD